MKWISAKNWISFSSQRCKKFSPLLNETKIDEDFRSWPTLFCCYRTCLKGSFDSLQSPWLSNLAAKTKKVLIVTFYHRTEKWTEQATLTMQQKTPPIRNRILPRSHKQLTIGLSSLIWFTCLSKNLGLVKTGITFYCRFLKTVNMKSINVNLISKVTMVASFFYYATPLSP